MRAFWARVNDVPGRDSQRKTNNAGARGGRITAQGKELGGFAPSDPDCEEGHRAGRVK